MADLISFEDAFASVERRCVPLATTQVRVEDALGSVLARDVTARRTLPPWANSAMDGYALRAQDAASGSARLTVVSKIFAGQVSARALAQGECARIMTGGPIPQGADCVVMQEQTRAEGSTVEVLVTPQVGQCVRPAGEDAFFGQTLLPKGTALGLPELGLLWAQEETQVEVYRRPRVAILSTGDELCPVGTVAGERIVDTNGPTLAAAVKRAGGVPTYLGLSPDDLGTIVERARVGLDYDVLITSAGASVGEHDFVKEALNQMGVTMDFWRVAIKPAKPLAVGTRGATLVFGLPGNPTSSLVSFELFVRPALRRLLGDARAPHRRVSATLTTDLTKSKGLRHFVRATVDFKEGRLWATPLDAQGSGALRSASQATHLISLAPSTTRALAGEVVELIEVSWGPTIF